MRYCLALRERRPSARLKVFKSLGILETDIYVQVPRSGILRPSYVLLRDTQLRTVVLAVRGTHSLKVLFRRARHTISLVNGIVFGRVAKHAEKPSLLLTLCKDRHDMSLLEHHGY